MMRRNKPCGGQCTDCYLTSMGKRYLSRLPQGLMGETDFIVNVHRELGYFPNAKTLSLPSSVLPVEGAAPRHRNEGDGLTVGFLGELSELKAPDLLAKASHQLGGRDIRFRIGGKAIGAYGDLLTGLFAAGSAELLGWTEPETFFNSVDVLVLPSRGSEVFGRVLVEAYAHGIPVIGSDQGGIPESIEHGKSGFVFHSDDHTALANHLATMHDDIELYNSMAERGFAKSADYQPHVWQEKMMTYLEQIVADYRSAKTAA